MKKRALMLLLLITVMGRREANADDAVVDREDIPASTQSPAAEGTEAAAAVEKENGAPPDSMPVFDLADAKPDERGGTSDTQGHADAPTVEEIAETRQMPEASPAPAVEKARPGQKKLAFGLGVSLCGEHGCGVVTRFRLEHVSIDFSYGIEPILVSYSRDGKDTPEFEFDVALVHADGGVSVFFGDREKGVQDGIRFQGIFDNVKGPGGGVGWTRERQCSRFRNKCYDHFVFGIGAGIKFFPAYEKWVKDHFDLKSDEKTSPMNIVQMYLGVTLLWDI